jgi:hypothetical protein
MLKIDLQIKGSYAREPKILALTEDFYFQNV